ncbi:hypothetical protein LEMLEM_LOCUS20982 [Lemmus lemmus]
MSAAYKEDWKLLLEEQVPGVEMCLSQGLMNRSGGQMPAEKIQPDSAHRVKGRKGFVCSAAGWCQLRTQSRGRVHSLRAAAIASLSPSTKAVSPNTQSSGSNHASG